MGTVHFFGRFPQEFQTIPNWSLRMYHLLDRALKEQLYVWALAQID